MIIEYVECTSTPAIAVYRVGVLRFLTKTARRQQRRRWVLHFCHGCMLERGFQLSIFCNGVTVWDRREKPSKPMY
ncbi:hypothetical protein Y032_0017g3461 [Ancylostoma ceylanicum]|uniref:Uncharacterized protein n=1 Tax=Ancylostoma ceylanicum TaxID=53326 RepID=A0A016V5B7_9BILA|nr:hypothetical protein Y032_0017g3461 [Ancylostoma ceylanicum]